MKYACLFLVGLLLSTYTHPGFAQDESPTVGSTATQPATGRIAFVDLGRITDKAKQQAVAMDSISAEVRRIQTDVQGKLDKMRDLEREIQKSDGVVSSDELAKKRREVNKLKDELDALETKYKTQMRRMDETILEPLVKKIGYAIEDVAKERGFDLVLRGEAVFYGNPAVDLTDDVIKHLDKDLPETAARAASATVKSTPAAATSAVAAPATAAPAKETPKAATRTRPVDRQQDR